VTPRAALDRDTVAPSRSPVSSVLLLTPSRGLGGGIERYVQTVQSAFSDVGVASRRLDLTRPGLPGHRALLAASRAALPSMPGQVRLVIAHRALLPVAALLARTHPVGGMSVICHGSDVWGSRISPRRGIESWLMRGPGVRLVAVSSFTAGALVQRGPATILPPGLSRAWFSELAGAADRLRSAGNDTPRPDLEVMTAFRLSEWRDKGLPQLTAAIGALAMPAVSLTVCGSGAPPPDLVSHVRGYPWCTLRPGLSDAELAAQFARADLFVLPTRTRAGRRACGEGFGMVLLEAQVAGTAVVGPAHGGAPDAYLDGVTGATPSDESAAALGRVLDRMLSQPGLLAAMGDHAASVARTRFAPDRYAALAADRLL
jgi:phosphatidyl-myo-inositol dimannoside synthase